MQSKSSLTPFETHAFTLADFLRREVDRPLINRQRETRGARNSNKFKEIFTRFAVNSWHFHAPCENLREIAKFLKYSSVPMSEGFASNSQEFASNSQKFARNRMHHMQFNQDSKLCILVVRENSCAFAFSS